MSRNPPTPLVTLRETGVSPALFLKLQKAMRALKIQRLQHTYQTNFWFSVASRPTTLVEVAALQVLTQLPQALRKRVTGCEWWLSRMKTSRVMVDFHVDHDIVLATQTGRIRHPLVSSLLYLNRCRGGLLAVTKSKPNAQNMAQAPDVHDFDLVAPAPNRLVWFSGDLTHGVLDSENEIPHRRRPPEKRYRLAIAMNFWSRRPVGVKTFMETDHYRSLRIKGGGKGKASDAK